MSNNISDLLGGKFIRTTQRALPPEQQFINKIEDSGLDAPLEIISDGKIHRFHSGTGSSRERTGWYSFHTNIGSDICAGVFGEWKSGIEEKFISQPDREITAIEKMKISKKIEEIKQQRDIEKGKQYEVNADAVTQIWENSTPAASNHPYLESKGIGSHGAKVSGDGRLILPLYTPEGTLASLQYIGDEKRFHQGGKTAGCFHMVGSADSPIAYLVEGFADACTIVEETGCACYIAYSGANMAKVAPIIKEFVSNQEIVIISDNDNHGKGQEYAKKAADAINSRLIIPPEEGDINDYRTNGGDVKELLMVSREDHEREISEWLIPADEFCSQPAPIAWLVKGWIQDKALVMVHGPSGGGKTFLVLDMALRVASGLDSWHGHNVKPGNVFYLAGEGHHGLRSRFAGWKQENHVEKMDFWVSKTGLDLDKPEGYDKVVQSIKSTGKIPSLIIVDTLHRFLAGDENSAQDAKVMLDACSALMNEFGCTVLLVHHTGVSESAKERARGSSAWRGALDIEISITPGDKTKPIEVKQVKSKDAELQDPKFFTLESVKIDNWYDEDDEQVSTAILCGSEAPQKELSNKTKSHTKIIEEAWIASGKKREGDLPCVTRQDIMDFLSASGRTEESIKQEVKPGKKGRLVANLIDLKKIKKEGELYIVCDEVWMSIFGVLK
jgi:putative DNA primase/helicase